LASGPPIYSSPHPKALYSGELEVGVSPKASNKRSTAQKRYRKFVKEGLEKRLWEKLKGQIYLGSEEFIATHSPGNEELKEIPRAQLKAVRPTLERIFARRSHKAIVQAYREHGYRLHEIAAHLGVHYATVSQGSNRWSSKKRMYDYKT
jgi:Homeodomain-like domain